MKDLAFQMWAFLPKASSEFIYFLIHKNTCMDLQAKFDYDFSGVTKTLELRVHPACFPGASNHVLFLPSARHSLTAGKGNS